jgi:predicted CXXCH cytochrome family protein
MFLTITFAQASGLRQDAQPTPTAMPALSDQDCKDCHLDIAKTWSESSHAHAFSDSHFQEAWQAQGNQGDCLLCHTTNYQAGDTSFSAEGVSCEACHGKVEAGHPPAAVATKADTEYCGACHTTTLAEWRSTGHGHAGVGCTACHDPHSQQRLFEVSDDLCINCHKEEMQAYLEDLHIQKDIGCVDCHALVIPPETAPVDGIVPTGHAFTITPATCVACHTDALHAGFSLPGYENGAANHAETISATTTLTGTKQSNLAIKDSGSELSAEQQLQALESSVASRLLATLFQGGIIGLALGASTAWFVARNTRRNFPVEDGIEQAK